MIKYANGRKKVRKSEGEKRNDSVLAPENTCAVFARLNKTKNARDYGGAGY
jgi:hypothetical protein